MIRRNRLLAASALGVVILVVAGFISLRALRGPGIVYVTVPAKTADIESSVLATGTVRASELVSVGAQVSGQIKSMRVKLGDDVHKGQTIAQIDSVPQLNALLSAKAAVKNIAAQLQSSQATLEQTRLAWRRQLGMVEHDAGAQLDLETATANYKVAQASIAALKSQLEVMQIAMETARVSLGYTRIVSPIDGVVVAVLAVEGQTVNANQTTPNIVKIANLEHVTVKAQISEADIIRVKPGQDAYFTIIGDSDARYHTRLRAIEPAPDSIANDTSISSSTNSSGSATATAVYYNGLLDVPNSDGRLRISMTAQVHIVLAGAHNALLIPSAALQPGSKGERGTVRILDGEGHPVARIVTIGLNDNTSAQIMSGLNVGDKVIVGESRTDAKASIFGDGGAS